MRHVLTAVIATYILGWVPELFTGDQSWYMMAYVRDIQCALWIALSFHLIPPSKIVSRSILLAFFINVASEAQQYFIYTIFDYHHYLTSYVIYSILALTVLFYTLFKPYNYPSDPIRNPTNIYLCFSKPIKSVSLAGSLLGYCFGGMDIYTGGYLYGFKWSSDYYQFRKVDPHVIQRKYTIYDTGILCNDMIERKLFNLVKFARAGRLRIRCISTVDTVLIELGPRFRPSGVLGNIPSIYAAKVLR